MTSIFSRRDLLAYSAAACAAPMVLQAQTSALQEYGIEYLEGLGQPGAMHAKSAFIAPSKIDAAYSHVIYVNTSTSGGGGQKMWVLERRNSVRTASTSFDATTKTGWRLALHDADYWADKGLKNGEQPPYSWPVSTGRKYPGDRRSGPTPLGIFNADDRSHRHRRGWGSPGMYNSIYIDLHYSSGRASGVAMHGTTTSKYRLLGRADSHGCIRMQQTNADKVWSLFHPEGASGPASPLWGEVPRYFRSNPASSNVRRGYVRDGSFLYASSGQSRLTKEGYTVLFVFFRDDL